MAMRRDKHIDGKHLQFFACKKFLKLILLLCLRYALRCICFCMLIPHLGCQFMCPAPECSNNTQKRHAPSTTSSSRARPAVYPLLQQLEEKKRS